MTKNKFFRIRALTVLVLLLIITIVTLKQRIFYHSPRTEFLWPYTNFLVTSKNRSLYLCFTSYAHKFITVNKHLFIVESYGGWKETTYSLKLVELRSEKAGAVSMTTRAQWHEVTDSLCSCSGKSPPPPPTAASPAVRTCCCSSMSSTRRCLAMPPPPRSLSLRHATAAPSSAAPRSATPTALVAATSSTSRRCLRSGAAVLFSTSTERSAPERPPGAPGLGGGGDTVAARCVSRTSGRLRRGRWADVRDTSSTWNNKQSPSDSFGKFIASHLEIFHLSLPKIPIAKLKSSQRSYSERFTFIFKGWSWVNTRISNYLPSVAEGVFCSALCVAFVDISINI